MFILEIAYRVDGWMGIMDGWEARVAVSTIFQSPQALNHGITQ